MTERAQDVLARLRALPPEERRAVLELAGEDEPPLSEAQGAELDRRAARVATGEAGPGIPADVAMAKLRRDLAARREAHGEARRA